MGNTEGHAFLTEAVQIHGGDITESVKMLGIASVENITVLKRYTNKMLAGMFMGWSLCCCGRSSSCWNRRCCCGHCNRRC